MIVSVFVYEDDYNGGVELRKLIKEIDGGFEWYEW